MTCSVMLVLGNLLLSFFLCLVRSSLRELGAFTVADVPDVDIVTAAVTLVFGASIVIVVAVH